MKKIISVVALALAAGALHAQTMEDAINLSENNYYGSAKSVGLGNAVTAIGGDLGMLGINPAAPAVAGYSQFTITPGLTISSTTASYTPSAYLDYKRSSNNIIPEPGVPVTSRRSRFILPNIGFSLRFDNDASSALKSFNISFVSNSTNRFDEYRTSSALNSLSTLAGNIATFATIDGMPGNILSNPDRYGSGYSWNQIVAYGGGLINFNADAGTYFGSTENVEFNPETGEYVYGLKGTLSQRSTVRRSGSKNDLLFNMACNINNRLYLGANLGMPVMNYRYDETFVEDAASDDADFAVCPEYYGSDGKYYKDEKTTFKSAGYQYVYNSSVDGIYLSLGAIWLPVDGLRLGGALRTPTVYTIHENYQSFVNTGFASGMYDASSEFGEYEYCLTSPWSFNLGAAYTFGPFGLVSVDYELMDYSSMHYSTVYDDGYSSDDVFYRVNSINRLFCGCSHSLRIGAEIKPLPSLALRAGYSFITDPQRQCTDELGNTVDAIAYDAWFNSYDSGSVKLREDWKYSGRRTSAFSLGAGYSSKGSFFADVALRWTKYPTTEFNPYGCYLYEEDVYEVTAPLTSSDRKLCDILFTFGWRF